MVVEWNVPKSTPMRVRPLRAASPDRGVGVPAGVGVDVLTGVAAAVGVVMRVGVDVLAGVAAAVGVDVLTGVLVGVGVETPGAVRVRTVTDCSMTVAPNWFDSVSVNLWRVSGFSEPKVWPWPYPPPVEPLLRPFQSLDGTNSEPLCSYLWRTKLTMPRYRGIAHTTDIQVSP